MIKPIDDFTRLFKVTICLNENLIVKKENRYFLLNEKLKKHVSNDFFYVGTYLGKLKNGKFFPSFELLRMMTRYEAGKVVVDKKTEWLFVCGRDIFKQGIKKTINSHKKGDHVLVLNTDYECLGFGRITCNLSEISKGVAVKNILDIGDFLRREKALTSQRGLPSLSLFHRFSRFSAVSQQGHG